MSLTGGDERETRHTGRLRPRDVVRQSFITGIAILIPLAVTLVVIGFVLNFAAGVLEPVVVFVQNHLPATQGPEAFVIQSVTVLALVALVFAVGFVARFTSRGTYVGSAFTRLMTSIPGLGSVYTSFEEMSELLLDSDTDSFQEVKLVEYPEEGTYTVAFKTAETPGVIEEASENEAMVTLFMPFAPNPVMGGLVIHVAEERVLDVDMTVEEGIRSIVTTGVAIGEPDDTDDGTEVALDPTSPTERGHQPAYGTRTNENADVSDE